MSDGYFTEQQTPHLRLGVRISRKLHEESTPYQRLAVYETTGLGRMLALDEIVQLTESDEWTYHEMMAHVPMLVHPCPRRALVVGGGDGGVLREILRHRTVAHAELVDIDEAVVRAAREFFPGVSCGFADPRARVIAGDGIVHVRDHPGEYDVIAVDSTDPIGPAVGLFQAGFYRSAAKALRSPGALSQQVGSPFYNRDFVRETVAAARTAFDEVRLYTGVVPTYPGGLWCYLLGIKGTVAAGFDAGRAAALGPTRYYSAEVHRQAFALPPFVAELLR